MERPPARSPSHDKPLPQRDAETSSRHRPQSGRLPSVSPPLSFSPPSLKPKGCQLSYIHPRLLTSLVLIDPVIQASSTTPNGFQSNVVYGRASTFRRDRWPSRAEAAESFRKSKFYQTWDPRVLDLWLEHGLRNLPTAIYPTAPQSQDPETTNAHDGPVTLATTKHQEVFMFLRPNFAGKDEHGNLVINRRTHPDLDPNTTETYPFYTSAPSAVFHNLPHLRPSTLFLFGGNSEMSPPDLRRQKIATTGTGVDGSGGFEEGKVKEVVLEGVGHLVPMIAPEKSAVAAAGFLAGELGRWRGEEEEWRGRWEVRGMGERMMVDGEWLRNLGGDPRAKAVEKL